MNELTGAWEAIRYGGAMVYPLLALGVIALIIILDRAVAYGRALRLPRVLLELVETYGFDWDELENRLKTYRRRMPIGDFSQ